MSELETKYTSHLHPAFFFGKIPCLLLGYNFFSKGFKNQNFWNKPNCWRGFFNLGSPTPSQRNLCYGLYFIPIETLSLLEGGRQEAHEIQEVRLTSLKKLLKLTGFTRRLIKVLEAEAVAGETLWLAEQPEHCAESSRDVVSLSHHSC